jgi:branched-chain amino acid transport system ATP-binding protein
MLEVAKLSVSYGQHRALSEVSLTIDKGEIVVILGANGAGKSTLLRAIGGMSQGVQSGVVTMEGRDISGLASHEIVECGIALVPEGRGVFADLTVHENLLLGAYTAHARVEQQANLERLLALFPKLDERRDQVVRTMSGGEQQMVAIGRAMMSAPSILMLDEPSLGLSPLLCKELFRSLAEVRSSGLGILLVEQNAKQSLAIADRGYLLENGEIIGQDSAERLADDPAVQKAYLGASSAPPPSGAPAADDQGVASALPFVTVGPGSSRPRTDDVVAGGIDELVRHAASLQADYFSSATAPKSAPRHPAKPYQGPGADLAAMLAGMERAAVEARLPAAPVSPPTPPAPPAPPASNSVDDAPTGEDWRRKTDIKNYRRADDRLNRQKGD